MRCHEFLCGCQSSSPLLSIIIRISRMARPQRGGYDLDRSTMHKLSCHLSEATCSGPWIAYVLQQPILCDRQAQRLPPDAFRHCLLHALRQSCAGRSASSSTAERQNVMPAPASLAVQMPGLATCACFDARLTGVVQSSRGQRPGQRSRDTLQAPRCRAVQPRPQQRRRKHQVAGALLAKATLLTRFRGVC